MKDAVREVLPRLAASDDVQIRAEEAKTRAALVAAGREEGSVAVPVKKGVGYGRNDMVTIKKGSDTKTLKFKKAEQFIAEGWVIVEQT